MEEVLKYSIEDTFKNERQRMLDFIKSKVRSLEESEDILQEVFFQAVKSVNSLQTIDNLIGWLYKIATNKVIDWYRKGKLNTISIDENNEDLSLVDMLESQDLLPEDENLRVLIADTIIESIDELPEKQKYVFVRQAIEGISFKEISNETGISINTLLARKQYAIKFLRQRLKEIKNLINE